MYQPVYRKQTNHLAHLLLSIMTLGLWIPVWILIAIVNASSRQEIVPVRTPQYYQLPGPPPPNWPRP